MKKFSTLSFLCLVLALAGYGPRELAHAQVHVREHIADAQGEDRLVWSGFLSAEGGKEVFAARAVEGRAALAAAPRHPVALPYEGNIDDLDAYWQAAFDPHNLYVRVHVRKPRGVFRAPKGGDEYGGDLIELFLDPSGLGQTKYQFCANPLGLRYDGYQNKTAWTASWTGTGFTEKDSWGVEYAVPLSCFGKDLKEGTKSIGINIGIVIDRQHVSWTGSWGGPGSYGRVSLGKIEVPETRHVALSLWLDRKVYDSLDLTAQGLLKAAAELPSGAELSLSISTAEKPVWEKRLRVETKNRRIGFLLDIRGLDPGDYVLQARLAQDSEELGRTKTPFTVVQFVYGAKKPAPAGKIPILIQPNATAAGAQPVTCGVPMPRGVTLTAEKMRLLDPDGKTEVPLQARVTARWSPRGYVRWVLLDFPGRVDPEKTTGYTLEYGPDVARAVVTDPVTVKRENGLVHVNTGPLAFTVREKGFAFLETAKLNGTQLIRGSRITLTDETGAVYEASGDADSIVTVEESGPIRAVIAARGWFVKGDRRLGQYVVRIYAYRGESHLRVFHTFVVTESTKKIRYRNISLESRLTAAGKTVFGLEKGVRAYPQGRHAYLVQESHDRYRVAEASGRGGERQVAAGRRARGWVDTGRVTVALRDLWQNFPKELEVENKTVRVHFWPRHPGPVRHPKEKVTARDIHMLWFAHEGKLLDFSIPRSYAQFHDKADPETHEFYYIPNAIKTKGDEALGIAKTHEMLWLFHATGEDPGRLAAAFQEEIGCLADPAWTAAGNAAGLLHPVDRERFPEVETVLEAHFDSLQRMAEYTSDYGMWNFGDRHTGWNGREKRVPVNRTWVNHHHGAPRTYWLLYLRSGDPKYLAAARRHALHLMDVDICHYSTPEYEAKGYPQGKIPGALCDYKGLVHWHSGNRLYDYNNLSDYLFYDYYLTGYRRSVDVAMETADSVARIFGSANSGRGGAGPLASLSFLYEATWDARLLPRIYAYARAMLASQTGPDHELGAGIFMPWAGYAPWLPRYIQLTRDPEAVRRLEIWCDWLAQNGFYGSGGALWPDLTEGYRLFGKPEYLAKGVAEMNLLLGDTFLERGHFYDGFITENLTLNGGFFSQRMPAFLAALASAEQKIVPKYNISWWMPGNIWMWINPKKHYAAKRYYKEKGGLPLVIVREDEDREFTLKLEGGFGKGSAWVTRGADGGEVARRELEPEGGSIQVPADGKAGEYILWIATDDERPRIVLPVSDLDKEVFAWEQLISRRMHAFFFKTEPGADEAVIDAAFGPHAGRAMVHRADGSIIKSIGDATPRSVWKKLRFAVTSDLEGQLLHFTIGRLHDEVNFLPIKGLIPWLAITPERYFVPKANPKP